MCGKFVLYIAMSLDGYIAGRDGDIAWLERYQDSGDDYGFEEFMGKVNVAVVGAQTYREMLRHPERLLKGVKVYVLSKEQLPVSNGFDVIFYNGALAPLVGKIRVETAKDVFVVGGGRVASSFLRERLLDELRVFVVPILVGEGTLLFSVNEVVNLELIGSTEYKSGIVELRYRLKEKTEK
jgi:dihydrofolate reductase